MSETALATVPVQAVVVAERRAAYAHAARGALAPETVRALRRVSAAFTAWATSAGVAIEPASPETVAAYVDHLAASGRKPAGIRQAIWGIGTLHRAGGLEDPTKAEVVALAIKRAARSLGTRQQQAAPLGQRETDRIVAAAGNSPAALRNVALLLTMRDLLARRSEVVALQVEDLTPDQDGTATAIIRRSKTDQEGRGEVRWLSATTVAAMRRWLDAAGITTGPVFRTVNKAGRLGPQLTGGEVPRILKSLAQAAGLDADRISGHSCRVGMAQDLVAVGADLAAVMQAGRWKSPMMPARYAENLLAGRGAVAEFHRGRAAR